MSTTIQQHYRVCNLCEAMCGLEITHDGERVISVKGDPDDPLSKGSICPKGALIQQLHEDPDRLKQPLRKMPDGSWQTIGWTEALDLAGERLNTIRREHGADAVGLYFGNPTVHNFGIMTMLSELRRIVGSRNVFSPTSMDQLPHHFMAYYMFGHPLNIPIPDVDRTDYLIIIGANPLVSNGSLMSAPGINRRLKTIRERGGKIVQFDPRYNETSRVVDAHHFIRPGTDLFLLLGMLHLIQKNDWVHPGRLSRNLNGLEQLKGIAANYPPERVEELTGVAATEVERITRAYANCEKAVIYGRMGMSTQEHGGLCHWLVSVINILTGHFDTPGGAMFTLPAVDVKRSKRFRKAHGRWRSRVRGLAEFGGEIPVSVMAEEITTPGKGQMRALIIHAGNPVLSAPNGKLLDEALPQLDFMVAIDIFLNETTRHADLILPPPSHLEVDHYDLIFNVFAVADNAKFSPALFKPASGQLYDWQIARELIARLAKASPKKPSAINRWLNPRQILNLGLLTGPYGRLSSPRRWFSGLSLGKLRRSVHGISLGPLKSRVPELLLTKSGKIELAAPVYLDGLAKAHEMGDALAKQTSATNEFQLIGRRHLRSNNSWLHNAPGLMRGRKRCTLMLHPEDAKKLGITDGQTLTVTSATGHISLPCELTDTIMPGVVSIPHGFGHHRAGVGLSVASTAENAGVSLNDITDQHRLDPVTGNAAFSGQPVKITVTADPPATP